MRSAFLVAAALILAASAPPQPVASPKQASAEQQAADSLSNIAATYKEQAERAERSKETEPCGKGDDRRYSDLCAQWKAADAASLSAWLGWISLVGVIAALVLNAHSNWIASWTARQQLRPYLTVEHAGYFGVKDDGLSPRFSISYINKGQTPAYDYRGKTTCYVAPIDHIPTGHTQEEMDALGPDIVGPGGKVGRFDGPFEITPRERAGYLEKTHAIFIVGSSEYRDAFGRHFGFYTAYRSVGPDSPVVVRPMYSKEFRLRRKRDQRRKN